MNGVSLGPAAEICTVHTSEARGICKLGSSSSKCPPAYIYERKQKTRIQPQNCFLSTECENIPQIQPHPVWKATEWTSIQDRTNECLPFFFWLPRIRILSIFMKLSTCFQLNKLKISYFLLCVARE